MNKRDIMRQLQKYKVKKTIYHRAHRGVNYLVNSDEDNNPSFCALCGLCGSLSKIDFSFSHSILYSNFLGCFNFIPGLIVHDSFFS